MQNTNIDENESMLSFDIKSLFTSIPVSLARSSVERALNENEEILKNNSLLDISDVLILLDLCLDAAVFI